MPRSARVVAPGCPYHLTYYWGLYAHEERGPGSIGKDMLKPVEGSDTYEYLDKEDMLVVYPRQFISQPIIYLPVEYYFAVAQDPGYGEVDFWLFDNEFFLREPVPRQWARLGRCCRSERCPDCVSGFWSGAIGSLSVGGGRGYPTVGGGIVVAAGELYTWGAHYLTEGISIVCGAAGFVPTSYIGISASGMYCGGVNCIEDLEGIGPSFSASGGGLMLSGGGSLENRKGCVSFGVGRAYTEGSPYSLISRACRIETLSGP